MKTHVSSLDLSYLVRELKELEGCRLNKVYQEGENFLFDLHKPEEGKRQLRILLPGLVFVTKYKPDFPDTPPEFAMFLRKRLSGAFIEKVEQRGFDRVLELTFDYNHGKYVLVVELFSKGNVVLCDEEYEIVSPLKNQTWQSRTIRGGTEYEYPPEPTDPFELGFDEFWHLLERSDMDSVVKSLAVDVGLGGLYAEEACARAGIDKELSSEELVEEKARKVFEALQELLDSDIEANRSDYEVFPFKLVTKEAEEEFESFNEAVDEVVSKNLVELKKDRKEEIREERVEKVKRIIEDQEDNIKKLERDIEENKRKGELLYENYQDIRSLLYEFNQDRDELSWDELKRKYESHDLVEQVNEKDGFLVVDV